MGVWREESHLAFCIAAIGAVCVGLDELPNGQAIRGFAWREGCVLAHDGPPLTRTSRPIGVAMSTSSTSNPRPGAFRTSAFMARRESAIIRSDTSKILFVFVQCSRGIEWSYGICDILSPLERRDISAERPSGSIWLSRPCR